MILEIDKYEIDTAILRLPRPSRGRLLHLWAGDWVYAQPLPDSHLNYHPGSKSEQPAGVPEGQKGVGERRAWMINGDVSTTQFAQMAG